jgi:hypothetical protein
LKNPLFSLTIMLTLIDTPNGSHHGQETEIDKASFLKAMKYLTMRLAIKLCLELTLKLVVVDLHCHLNFPY